MSSSIYLFIHPFIYSSIHLSIHPSIHYSLRWTGSNTNPNNNDGQGKAGTDRSNMVLLRSPNYNEGTPGVAVPLGEKRGHLGNSYPQNLTHSETFLDLDQESRDNLAMLSPCKYLL